MLAPAEGVESFHSVAASGQTAFMQRLACVKPSCSNGGDLLRVDLATGAAVPFDGCLDDGVCAGCPDGRFFALGLRGTVLSSHLPCSEQSAVTDLADGATRHLDGDVLDAVGDLAVVHTDAASSGTLTVRDWRTGRVVTVADGVDLGSSSGRSRSTRTAPSRGRMGRSSTCARPEPSAIGSSRSSRATP